MQCRREKRGSPRRVASAARPEHCADPDAHRSRQEIDRVLGGAFAYYEAITVRVSSLSASVQALVAVEVGHLDLVYEDFRETALIDLRTEFSRVVVPPAVWTRVSR